MGQFSKFSLRSVQRRHLALGGVWPGKFGRPILLERQWPVPIFQELYSIVLDGGPRAIFKVQPAKCTEAASCPWRGSGQESSADQSYWSGTGQFPSFRNCRCERKSSSAAWFFGSETNNILALAKE